MRWKKPTQYLLTLKQKETESLKNYVNQFNQEKLTVDDPKEDMVLAALFNGVRAKGPLMAELARKPLTTL